MAARFSVTVDPELLEEVITLSGARSKREAIERALVEFVRHRRLEDLEELAGSDSVEMGGEELKRWRESGIEES